MFPLFRSRFIPEIAWSRESCCQETEALGSDDGSLEPVVRMAGCGPAAAVSRGPANFIRPLMLDLNTLPREDGPPSESVLKRQKFAVFEKHCSQVADGLYVSGEAVARDRTILAQHNISHVVNCVGALYPEYFKADGVHYKTLWLQDHPQEDITCVLYDTFDFIEAARKGSNTALAAGRQQQQPQRGSNRVPPLPLPQPQQQRFLQQQQQQQQQQQLSSSGRAGGAGGSSVGGRVLVHCSQGVSRSTTIAIAYLMWKTGGSYDEVYPAVRALRGVTSPNVGFMCQLINWAKRRQRAPARVRLYRVSPHCADAPLYLVPKGVSARPGRAHPDWTQLDPRGCFVAHLPNKVYVWRGQQCMHRMLEAGVQAAAQLSRYEGAPAAQVIRQGEEPEDFLSALAPSSSGSSTCGDTSSCCTRADSAAASKEPSSNSLAANSAAAAASALGGIAVQTAAGGSWDCGSQRQQLDMDTDMTSAAPSAAGTRPSSAQQQVQQQVGPTTADAQQWPQQQQQQAGAAATLNPPPTPHGGGSSQLRTAGCIASAGGAAAVSVTSGRMASVSSPGGEVFAADAAAAAAHELLSVQLGSAGEGLRALQQVGEYDGDFELWLGALHRSSQSEGGRQQSRSPLAAADGLCNEVSPGQPPGPLDGRNKKCSRSDSEGRMVIPTCRQPGRLSSSSSSQAWPDGGTPRGTAAGADVACPAAAAASSYAATGGAAAGPQQAEGAWLPAAADGVVDMRVSSTGDSI